MQNNSISVSDFKTHCLEIITKLKKPIMITKHDKPVARLEPLGNNSNSSLFGSMKERAKIKKDIVKSLDEKWSCEDE